MEDQVRECEVEGGNAEEPVCGTGPEAIDVEVALGPLDHSDMSLVRAWRNDYRIWRWCRQNDFISDAQQLAWFNKQTSDPSVKMYKISASLKPQIGSQAKTIPVGVCGLTSIDQTNRRAEFSLYIAPGLQKGGFGGKALECLLTHGFMNLGLNVIWGEVFEGNPAMKLFEALGFQKEGIRRDFYFRDGKYVDAHLISIRASEWLSKLSQSSYAQLSEFAAPICF